jgi:glycerol uptake operon antiterminator
MRHSLLAVLERNPVIASVKEEAGLGNALDAPCEVLFLLCGDVCSVPELIGRIHKAGKKVIVHVDLIGGLNQKEIAVDYLKKCGADGIISTRPALIRRAREVGLLSVLRIFAIDSRAVNNLSREQEAGMPDMIEVLPGVIPKVITKLDRALHIPVIAGGLIEEKADVVAALGAGAVCVSTSRGELWNI